MLSREERKRQADARYARRLAEEELLAEEAREKEAAARLRQRELQRKERFEQENERQAAAEHRLQQKARRRALKAAQEKDKEEGRRARAAYREKHPGFYDPNLRLHSVLAVLLAVLALFMTFSFLLRGHAGQAGNGMADALLGSFSYTAYLIPIMMLVHAVLWRQDVRNRALVAKALCFIPVLLLSATLAEVLAPTFQHATYDAGAAYLAGQTLAGGGAIGGAIGYALYRTVGMVGIILLCAIVYPLYAALYFRVLAKELYTRAHLAIKARRIERAKLREERRAAETAKKAEEKQQRATMKEEERQVRLEEQRAALAMRREAAITKQAQKQQPTLPPKAEEEPLPQAPTKQPANREAQAAPSVRERILFNMQAPANTNVVQRRLPDAIEEAPTAPTGTRERRRALFADLEEDQPALARRAVEEKPTTEKRNKQLFDFDHMPITAPEGNTPRPERTAVPVRPPKGNYENTPIANDPMRNKGQVDLTHDSLAITKEDIRPHKATQDEPTSAPSAKQSDGKSHTTSAVSPLGKLFRRHAAAMAQSAADTQQGEPKPEEQGMDYFRQIATSANERPAPDAERIMQHPDVLPMPQRKPPVEELRAAETVRPSNTAAPIEDVQEETEPPRVPNAAQNPFHPQNNPHYQEAATTPPPRYNGVQDASLFSPTGMTKKPVQQAMPVKPMPQPAPPQRPKPKPYQYPPISLLTVPEVVDEGNITAEVQSNAEKLVTTLDNFRVRTQVTGYSRGPRITRYEVVPEAGIRVRAISALVEDISMSLATSGIRIEAPIPGKSAVGIEVPNSKSTLVRLRAMLDSEKFRNFPDKTMVCLGGDVTGQPVYCDLAKMPHLLVAGATGMGKSVCINSIITSLLYKATPAEVKLIMIDPKKVEFNIYAGIPHLLVPVVTDPKKAAGALSWAVNEMERRFSLIEQAGVRDIKGYNQQVSESGAGEMLPKIIIIIDELHDLMMSAADAVETSIARIAAKARAAGIHLLIGTQRPSVDVITGTIKANIPSRIAFHVSSQVDSRTILDFTGAEKLLTHGDMLFAPAGAPKPLRVQGAFVDDKEIDRVVEFLKTNNEVDSTLGEEIMADIEREAEKCVPQKKSAAEDEGGGSNIPTDDDDNHLQWAALQVGFEFGKMSTSLLQRKLSIGYGKAAKILDALEDQGYISPPDGSRPREIRITQEEFKEMMARTVAEKTGGNF